MGVAMAHHHDHAHEEHGETGHSHDHGKAHMLGS
jgi:F-type H+-transporting ATPase subunit a